MKRKPTHSEMKIKRKRLAAASNSGPKALAGSISRFCRVLAVSAITALGLGEASAVTLFWDGASTGGANLGGGGNWDLISANWWTGAIPATWNNGGTTDAIFTNFGGNISVDNDILVRSLTFNADAFQLGGSGSLGFGNQNGVITVSLKGQSAEIATFLKGSAGFTKAGAGDLILKGDNTAAGGITGGITISGGTLILSYTSANPTAILNTSNSLTFTSTSEFQFQADGPGNPSSSRMALSTLTFSAGEGTVHSAAVSQVDNAVLTFSSLASRAAGATGNFVQDSVPPTLSVTAGGSGMLITLSTLDAGKINEGDSVNGTNIGANSTVLTKTDNGNGTTTLTLSAAMTGAPSTQKITFGLQEKRITFTTSPGAGFLNQGLFFNGSSYAWYDTTNFARVRGINYGADAGTATQGASATGILAASAGQHVQVTGDLTGLGNISIKTLNLDGSSFSRGILQNPGTTLTLTNAGILKSGGGSVTISGGTILASPLTTEFVLRADQASDRLVINSVLTGNGGLTKSGQGSVLLNPQTSGALSLSGTVTTSTSSTLQLPFTAPQGLVDYVNFLSANGLPPLAVNGPGIPANTTISSISGSTVTLSQPATANAPLLLSYSTALDTSTTILQLTPAQAATLTAGQVVSGIGIAPNTTIAIGGINTATGAVTLSNAPTQSSSAQNISFGGATVAFGSTQNYSLLAGPQNSDHGLTTINTTTVKLLSAIPGLLPGMSVDVRDASNSLVFPAGTTIQSVSPDGLTVTVSQVATSTSTSNFGAVVVAQATVGGGARTTAVLPSGVGASVVPGTLVTGFNVPPGTTVTGVSVDTVTFSATIPASQTYQPNSAIPASSSTITLLGTQTPNLYVNEIVSGPGIPSGTTITAINNLTGVVTLSNPTTAPIGTGVNLSFGAVGLQGLTFGGATVTFGGNSLVLTPAQAATLVVGSTVTGTNIAAGTTVTSIQDFGTYRVATLSTATNGAASPQFLSFGGATVVGINSAYGGGTQVNAGIFAVSAAGLPAAGAVRVAGGAQFAALNSVITNAISLTGSGAALSGAGGSNSGFSGAISAGVNDFQFIARDFRTPTAADLLVSGNITGTGRLIVPSASIGVVTLTGNNSAFTGPVTIENAATLSVARINSLFGNSIDLGGTVDYSLDGNGGTAYTGGNGTGALQTLVLNNSININGGGTIQPDRDGTGYGGYFTSAGNKTIQLNALTMDAETLTVQNNAGSGVLFSGTTTVNGSGIFNVVNATASSAVPGLTLGGVFSGGGIFFGSSAFVKTGAGTLVLANSANTFGGNGSFIDVQGGVLSVATDGALGNSLNAIQLSNGTLAALRATGSFTTTRQVILNTATGNTLEVTAGNTLTLNSQLVLPTGLESNALIKGDNGVLILGGNNNVSTPATLTTSGTEAWAGLLTINAGAVRISNGNALGTTAAGVTVARTGAALQLTGVAAVADRLTLAGSGINSGGAVQGISGTSNLNGQVVLSGAGAAGAMIGADTGTVVNIAGGITGTAGANLTLNASGTGVINITGNPLDPAYTFSGDTGSTNLLTGVSNVANLIVGQRIRGTNIPAGATITAINSSQNTVTISANATNTTANGSFAAQGVLTVVKIGTGTAALQINSPDFGGSLTVNQGTFSIAGSGVTIGAAAGANVITVQGPSGTLTLNDSAGTSVQRIAVGPTYTATVGNGSTTFTLTPVQVANLAVGQTVTGIGIAPNTTISSFSTTNGVLNGGVTLSTGTTGTSGSQALTFGSRNLVMVGGNFSYTGNTNNSVQNLGWLTALRGGTNVISSNQTGGGTVAINFGGLASSTAIGAGATVGGDASIDFQGATLGVTGANRISFAVAPSVTGGLIQRATLNGTDFVTYNSVGGLTLTTTAGNATIPVSDTSALAVGQTVTGTGIPAGVTILSIVNNTSITLSTGSGVVAGTNFLTFGNTNGVEAFRTYNNTNNIDASAAGDTLNLTANPTSQFTAPRTVNAFRISGGITAGDNGLRANSLTVSSGAILSTTGTNTVNFKVLAFGGSQAFVAVNAGGTLIVNSLLTGSGGFVKGLGGDLRLSPPPNNAGYANLSGQTLFGNFSVNAGTVQLKSGQNNTLTPNQFLILAPGTTLDLNGTSQFAQGTRGDGAAIQGNAGTFTNSSVSPAALIFGQDTGGTNFGGVITQQPGQGAMSFFKGGPGTYGFLNPNPYSGATIFAGGTNTLLDGGTLPATSSIGLNYARLLLDDNQSFATANRVNTAATITLKGGSIVYQGRAQTATSQTVGGVVLSEGQNMIQAIAGGTGVNSAVLTLASLTRPGGSSATLRFPENGLGLVGNNANIIITAAPVLTQNLIGAWAVVDREYASYVATRGVGALSATGFAGYSTNFLNRQPLATDNIRATISVPGLTVDTTVNTLAVNSNVAAVNGVPVPTTINLGGKKLTLAGGGLLLALSGDNQNITIQNGTITSGAVNVGGDLYLQALNLGGNNRTFTIGAGITDNGTGAVRLIKSSVSGDTAVGGTTADFTLISGVNTYTGGTVINGGNLVIGAGGNIPAATIPANGLIISGGDVSGVGNVFQDPGGVIAASNIVTVNGLGALTLSGNNTLAGLVFNNAGGGTTAPTVTTFRTLSPIGTGTLTLGGGGITSTPVNPAATATVAGRLDFGVAASTVLVNAYNFNGFTDFAPTTPGLILQGVIGSGGGINKTGAGVLQLNAQAVFNGPLNVQAGTVQLGGGNAGSRFSRLNLSTPTSRLNVNNQSTTLGSLAGSGIVTNTAVGTPTLTVGFDNSNSTFSGQISRFNDATPNALTLVKIGSGTLTMTSAQNTDGSSGGITVNGGGLTYSGAGAAYPSTVLTPVTFNVNTGGTLTLDNAAANLPSRLGLNASQGTLNLSGGTLAMVANSAGSNEVVNILNFGNGASTIRLTAGAAGATTIDVTSFGNQGGQSSGLITGVGLGGTGAGSVNVAVSSSYNVPGTQGGGAATTEILSIRPDILGDATGGPGTGFITRDSGTNFLRPLNQTTELSVDMVAAATAGQFSNTGLTSPNNATGNRIIANQTINSLTLLGSGAVTLNSGLGVPAGSFAASGLPLTLSVGGAGILALTNATIGLGAISTGGITADFHVVGAGTTLTLNGSIVSSTSGIVKADAGTLTLNARQYYTNSTTVNAGTLILSGGDNTIVVQPTGSIPTLSAVAMNGGTLDLKGTNQVIDRILNNNPIAGTGGVIINSAASPVPVTLTSATATGTTFAGSIGTGLLSPAGNAINFVKSGNSTLTLTNVNSYTGSTVLRGGQIVLQDSGTLGQTSGITINFGTLLLNEAGLNPTAADVLRVPEAAPIVLNGGTLQQNSGGSLDATSTFNTITVSSGTNTIAQGTLQNSGSSALMSIGSLVQQTSVGGGPATVNFLSTNGTLGGGGLNNNQIQIGTITSSGGTALSAASAQVNGILPAWITINGSDFAGYLATPVASSLGIGAIGSANYPGYTGTPATANSANNLSVTTVVQSVAGRTINSLAIRNPGGNVDAVAPITRLTDTLSISSGGLLLNAGANGGASANVQGGLISAGAFANSPAALYVTASGSNPNIINSQIVDNANQTFSANTDGVSNVVTVSSTSGLKSGQAVSGFGIPSGATITAITSPTTFTISANTIASSILANDVRKSNAATVLNSTTVNVGNAGGLIVGAYVTGPGIQPGTTVTALGTPAAPGTITVSLPATVSMSQQSFFLPQVGNNRQNFTITPAQAATLTPGMSVTGAGIPPNTTVASVNPTTGVIGLSNPTIGNVATQLISFGATLNFARLGTLVAIPANTNNPTAGAVDTVVTVQNSTGLAVGMLVSGPGIPAGTTINSFTTQQALNGPQNSNPANTVWLRAPSGQNFDQLEANIGVNLVFGNGISVGNNTAGAVSLVKTGTGTLTLRPQPILSGSTNTNTGTSNIVTVTSTAGLVQGMTVSGTGIPAGARIVSINSTTGTFVISANATVATAINAPTQFTFGPGTAVIPNLATSLFSNTYTGGTFVNQGLLALDGFAGTTAVPGDISISNATVNTVTSTATGTTTNNSATIGLNSTAGLEVGMAVVGPGIPTGEFITAISGNNITVTSGTGVTARAGSTLTFGNPQQIAAASNATINGSGTLNLFAANTLASLRFNNTGGNANPMVSGAEQLTLTAANAITSVNDNLSTTPTITGKMLVLSNAAPVINTSGLSPVGLVINSPISSTGPVSKTGTGSLALTPNFALANSVTQANGTTISVPSTQGLAVGMQVTGTGLPGPVSIANGATTAASNIISFNANTSLANLTVGMLVVGINVPGGATITAIDNTAAAPKVTLSTGIGVAAGSASTTNPLRFGDNAFITAIGTNSITISPNVGSTAPVAPATSSTLTFTGSAATNDLNLNGGSLILTQSSSQLTVVGTTTAGSTTIAVTSTAGLAVGMAVSGVGLPVGETITAIGAGTITVSTGTNVSAQGSSLLTFSGNPSTILSGPIGKGAINMADGTALLSDGSLRTISNTVNIALNATFGPLPGTGTALAGNGVTLAGAVNLTNGGAHTITVPDLQNVTTIAGQLSGGNNLSLTKAGTGTLVLGNAAAIGSPAANTYTGTTAINVTGGVLRLGASAANGAVPTGAAAAVPAGLSLSVSPGAVYDINGSANQVLGTLTNPSPGTAGNGGLVTNSSNTAATLFIGGTSTTDPTSNLPAVFDGMLTAAGLGNLSVTKVGAGTLTLNGSSNYTGATTVNFGKLVVNGALGATTVTVNTGAALGGTGSIGVSTITPGGIFPGTGGGVILTGGTFDLTDTKIGSFAVSTTGANNALTLNTGAILKFDYSNNAVDRIDLGNASLLTNAASVVVNFTPLGTLANGIYNLITFGARSGAGTYTLGTGAPALSTLTLTGSALILNVGNVPLNFYWKGSVSNSWSAASLSNFTSDAGGATNTGANLPTSTSIVNFNATGFNAANLNTTLGADFTIDSLNFLANSTTPVTIGGANTLTLNNNISMAAGAAAATISTSGFILGSAQTWSNASSSALTVSAPVTGNQPLTIASPGTATGFTLLSGNNSGFTGGITLNGNGTNTALRLGSATALGPIAGPNPLIVNNGALDMNGQNATVSSLTSTSNTGIIRNDLTGTTSTLSVIQSGTTTYSGVFRDGAAANAKLALVVDGGGTLQLITPAAANVANFSGGTTIGKVGGLGGTVRLGNGGSETVTSLGTGPVTINTGGTLNLSPGNVSTTFSIANSFILAGGQIQSSGGNQRLVSSSGVGANNITAVASTTSTITPSATLGQDLFIDGILAGSGSLSVGGGGSGKVILTNNANTYNGQITSTSSGNLQLAGTVANSTALQFADLVINSGANGFSFGSTVTSASLGSLSGGGNFALQNSATTNLPVALTVGANNNIVPLIYTGVMSNSTGISGTFTKTGTGTLTLTGINTYRGTTTVNGSGRLILNNNSVTASVTGLGNVIVGGTATLAGNGVAQGGDNVTAGVVTLGAGTFLDPGITPGAFGTLRFGVQSAAAVSTAFTLSPNSTYQFDVGAGASSFDRVIVAGSAVITNAKLAINAIGAPPDQGRYTLLSTTGGVTGTFASPTGVPANYSVVYGASQVDLQRFSTIGSVTPQSGLQVITGGSVPFNIIVSNSAPADSSNLSFFATAGTRTAGGVASAGSPIIVGANSDNGPVGAAGLSFNSAAVPIGTGQTGSFTVSAANANSSNTSLPGSVSVDVLDHAAFTGFTGGTLNVEPVREGYTGPYVSTTSLPVTNPAGFRVNLKGSTTPISNVSLTTVTGITPGSTGNITASLSTGLVAGAYNRAFSYVFADDSTLNGSSANLGAVNINVNLNVYTGKGIWGAAASGAWGTFGSWQALGGYPGLDGPASIDDTATFGSTLTGTASLNGVTPALNKLTFTSTSGTIAQGTGSGFVNLQSSSTGIAPIISATGGTAGIPVSPIISAPLVFTNTVTVTPATAFDTVNISGEISGPGGLIKTGAGTLSLTGTNLFAGKTAVNGGTLRVANEASFGTIPVTGGVPVADQISVDNGARISFAGDTTLAAVQGITVGSGNGTLDVAANKTVILNGSITGALTGSATGPATGTITKTGAGTLDLRGNILAENPLSAPTLNLNAGTLSLAAGPIGAQPTSEVRTGGVNFNGGTLAINIQGNGINRNAFDSNDFLLADNGTGTTPSVRITAPTNLSISISSGFVPTPDQDRFSFILDNTRTGADAYASFFRVNGADATQGTIVTVSGYYFKVDYHAGTNQNEIALLSVVPEPGTAALLLGAVGILGGVVRRRRARNIPFGI